jgi:hypothetical protein
MRISEPAVQGHTELPWKITWFFGTAHIVGNDDAWAAQCHTKEDAAFIVRACNAHDELVAALQAAIEYVPDALHDQVHAALATATK